MNEQACDPNTGPIPSSQHLQAMYNAADWKPITDTRTHQFTVDACGGDAELICVLQKVMERFTESPSYVDIQKVNPAAVAEWFYAKYGKP